MVERLVVDRGKFQAFFEPKSLAVIGVSLNNDRHPANVIFNKNYLRYPVRAFPVNRKGGRYQGEEVYASVSDIAEGVDLAVIAVRAEHVPGVLGECIEAGVGAAVIISGGFAEVGRRDLQDRIRDMAMEAAFPFIGPNCIGIFSPSHLDTFFIPSERMVMPAPGNVAIVSQSGGILADQMVKFAGEGVGLSRAVSIGNKAMISELDLLDLLVGDHQTRVIALYLEGFGRNEGREFVMAARKSEKPVIVLKAGKSPGGAQAVSSHTASMAGDYRTFSKALSQFGLVEARNELELVSFCESLSCYGTSIRGNIGIVTGSGGHGALAVDVCAEHGLRVPELSEGVRDEMRQRLSPSIRTIASLRNPVDLTGSARDDDFVAAVDSLIRTPEIDCIILLLLPYLPGTSSDLGARLSQLYLLWGKPLIAYVPHVEKYRMLMEGFELNGVPVSHSIEGAVLMAEGMRRCMPC
ncbi:MAG: CoA-binding protein [Deltaproteobacteria bacterium]|nr:CoA-binding protein [Deltaproteobacteria bacterium]MBW2136014.1 CoA-binding protein [Deltaproteobacteria bacterium]